jgi:hypothetical protein
MKFLAHFVTAFVLTLSWNAYAKSSIKFDEVAEEAGIADHGINGAGIGFWDYDQDGDLDVYINNSDSGNRQFGHRNRLYENDGTGHFRDVAVERGVLSEDSLGRGITWGDYDNDGDTDLLLGNMRNSDAGMKSVPTTLYKNLLMEIGEPNFENVTIAARLMRPGNERDKRLGGLSDTSGGIAWADYDYDGWLDLLWRTTDDDVEQSLFRNNGDGTFTEVTKEAGVEILKVAREADSQGSAGWFDFDQDGHLDLIDPNEGSMNNLFHNNGDGTFTDVTKSREPPSGIAFLNPGNANGICLGDIDNDGDIDAYFPNADQANRLVRNDLKETGQAIFTDITIESGAGDRGGARGCTMADYDNDGYLDIYVNNGGPSNTLFNDIVEGLSPFVQFYIAWTPGENGLYQNNGDGTFTNITQGSGAEGNGIGVGVASGDVNGDGFMDIIAVNRTYYNRGELISESQQNFLFLNKGNRNNWIKVALKGTTSNRSAFNARVIVTAGNLVQTRELYSATGYNSQDDPTLNFGLARKKHVDSIEVIWPSGKTQRLEDLEPGQVVTIVEPE